MGSEYYKLILVTQTYDATDQLDALAKAVRALVGNSPIILPINMKSGIDEVVEFLNSQTSLPRNDKAPSPLLSMGPSLPQSIDALAAHAISKSLRSEISLENDQKVTYNVNINAKTTLTKVIFHPPGAVVEYPETSACDRIGHLFTLNAESWTNPARSFAYSQGEPSSGKQIKTGIYSPPERRRGKLGAVHGVTFNLYVYIKESQQR